MLGHLVKAITPHCNSLSRDHQLEAFLHNSDNHKTEMVPPPLPSDSPNETTRPDSLEQSGLPRLMRIKKGMYAVGISYSVA